MRNDYLSTFLFIYIYLSTYISISQRSSPSSLEQTLEVAKSLNFEGGVAGGRSPRYETPPGTPPPPYNPFGGSMAEPGGGFTNRGLNILTMEVNIYLSIILDILAMYLSIFL